MRWDERTRRYVDDNGRVIPPSEVRKRVERYIESEKEDVALAAAKVIGGSLLVSMFFDFLADKIRTWHYAAGVMAYGGELQMNGERWARLENKTQTELEFLVGFEKEIQGAAEITEALGARAQLYAESIYATYENNVMAREWDAGVTLGRRISEEDSASCDECVAAADTYYVPLSEIPEIGTLQCLTNCRCTIEYAEPNPTATLWIDAVSGESLPA